MELIIARKRYNGVESGNVFSSIDSISNVFTATLKNFTGRDIVAIKVGAPITINFDQERILTGYIDSMSLSLSNFQTSISIQGRSKAGDLVDCTLPDNLGTEWKSKTILEIANIWGSQFGISFKGESGSVVETVNYEFGTEIFYALREHTEKAGLIIYSLPDGNCQISLVNTGSSGLNFAEGQNIISANGDISRNDIYSEYVVKGSSQSEVDQDEEAASNIPKSIVKDNINRFRPLALIADGNATIEICKKRAAFEAKIRRARSESYVIVVKGWVSPIHLNQTAQIDLSDSFGIKKTLLITSIDLSTSEAGGSTTTLRLSNTEAFSLDPTRETLVAQSSPLALPDLDELLENF